MNCTALEKLTLGNRLEIINHRAFHGCNSLKLVEIDPENKTFQSIDGVIFKNDRTKLELAMPGLTGHYSVPEGTEIIGPGAFTCCRNLTSVSFPSSLKEIGDGAFWDCQNLTDVHFPSSLEKIGNSAFYNCHGMKEIVIPANVSEIGYMAFQNIQYSSDLTPILPDKIFVDPAAGSVYIGNNIFGFKGKNPLVYPELPITFVSDKEQKRRLALGFCLHPEKYYGEYKKIYLRYVKGQRKSLLEAAKKMNLPEVEEFYQRLDAEAPAKKTEPIKTKMASGSLESVSSVAEDFIIQNRTLIKYVGSDARIAIPDNVQGIEKNDFSGCKTVEEIIVPGSIETIGEKTFYDCKKLQKVVFEDGVTRIEKKAFSKCPKLQTVVILSCEPSIQFDFYKSNIIIDVILPNSSPSVISASNRIKTVVSTAEAWNSGVIGEIDPKSKFIGYVKKAAHQLIPIAETNDAVLRLLLEYKLISHKDIDEVLCIWKKQSSERLAMMLEYSNNAKKRRSKKTESELEFDELVLSVTEAKQDWVYETRVWDKSYTKTETIKGIIIKRYKGYKADVEIPAFIGKTPVCGIEHRAFNGNLTITSVTIPSSVFEIKNAAFGGCVNLKRVEIFGDNVRISSAFTQCISLEEFVLHSSNIEFEGHPFQGCRKLMDNSGFVILNAEGEKILCDCNLPITAEELTVPDGVTIIDGWAFEGGFVKSLPPHNILKKVVLPDSVKRIGDDAFSGAVSLQRVVLPNGLEAIGQCAFTGCTMLRDIYLPESLTSLGGCIFYNCSNLTIHGVSGSAAESYAREYGFPFVEEGELPTT